MALNNNNNNDCCKCTTPEYEIVLNEQGPQGRQGEKGDAGFTPIISVKDNTDSTYTLNILTQDGQITTPNLKANLPAGGTTGQVLTKNSGEQDDCSWQNLPASTIETEGIARLATEADFETTEDTEASDNTIVTPALFNSELKKQSAKFVTTNTEQTITSKKTFMSDVTMRDDLILSNSIVNHNPVNGIKPYIIKHIPTNNTIILGETQAFTSEFYKNLGIEIQFDNLDNDAGIYTHRDGNKYPLLDSSNVTAGNNITINKTSTGITISSTGGGEIPTNVVTTDTAQTITGQKIFKNSFVTSDGTATKGNRVLINNSRIDLINNSGVAGKIDPEGIELRGGINNSGLSLQSSEQIVTFGQNYTPMRIYAIALERFSNANDTGAIILDAKNYKNYTYPKTETDNLLDTKVNTSDMVEVPVVVEQSDKLLMPSWYRVWSNGWIEQGGQISVTNTATVNLLKPYTQTNYLPNTQAVGNQANASVNPINVNSFSITSSASTAQDFNWYCVGY